jgi:hypothetical protein
MEQADCLRALERVESVLTAARSRVLEVFGRQAGCQDDGHRTARSWLRWQARITSGAAAGAVGWMRRLAAHPAIARALASGQLSSSWARALCAWSDLLPLRVRADADEILAAAALAGVDLAGVARLAEEIRVRTAEPDRDGPNDGFADRAVRLGVTYGGAGRLTGDLTPSCAAALSAVLEALGKRAGPEDLRSPAQRDHDALEQACRRLAGAGGLPDRAGQPTQIQLHMSLDQLRNLPGAASAEAAWAANRAGADTGSAWAGLPGTAPAKAGGSGTASAWADGWWPAAGPGADCDATIVPLVTGRVDREVLDQLISDQPARRDERATRALRQLLIDRAADILSGPAGLAAWLRTGLLDGTAASVSLPLDVGSRVETIPAHLRRAVIARDRHCRFPGCRQSPAASQVHHLIPRSEGGATALSNLLLLCSFHHLIAVHRWGWAITLRPDGTTSATSPHDARILHSHSPPATAAITRAGAFEYCAHSVLRLGLN